MKITNLELVTILNIFEKYQNKKFPYKITYAIMKNIALLKKEYQVYSETLESIVNQYKEDFVKENEEIVLYEIGVPKVKEEFAEEYLTEINKLLNIEINIDLYKISEECFDYQSERYDTLTVKETMELMDLLCEEATE